MISVSNSSFPVILVSAKDLTAASKIISEINDNVVPAANGTDHIWRISNKYYTTDVLFHPYTDADSQLHCDENSIQAHIIYLEENECNVRTAEQLANCAPGICTSENCVRVAACVCATIDDTLADWARCRRLEIVPLLEPVPPHADHTGPFADEYGVARVRAALHANRWHVPIANSPAEGDGSDSERSMSSEEWEGSAEEVERFAAALQVAAGARDTLSSLPRAERLDRAEELLAELLRALRPPPDDVTDTADPTDPPADR